MMLDKLYNEFKRTIQRSIQYKIQFFNVNVNNKLNKLLKAKMPRESDSEILMKLRTIVMEQLKAKENIFIGSLTSHKYIIFDREYTENKTVANDPKRDQLLQTRFEIQGLMSNQRQILKSNSVIYTQESQQTRQQKIKKEMSNQYQPVQRSRKQIEEKDLKNAKSPIKIKNQLQFDAKNKPKSVPHYADYSQKRIGEEKTLNDPPPFQASMKKNDKVYPIDKKTNNYQPKDPLQGYGIDKQTKPTVNINKPTVEQMYKQNSINKQGMSKGSYAQKYNYGI